MMRMTPKDEAQNKINSLMTEYCNCRKSTGNRARMKRIWGEVYFLLSSAGNPCGQIVRNNIRNSLRKNSSLNHIYEESDVLTDCLTECLMKYDTEKCAAFFPWFLKSLEWWINDNIYKKNTRSVTNEKGEKIRESRFQSLGQNEDGTEKDADSLGTDTVISPDEQTEGKFNAEAKIAQIFSYIRFMEHSSGKAANPARLLYSRCFVSDYLTCICKDGIHEEITINQQEAFRTMELDFLDFFMTAECRTLRNIALTALKTYSVLELSQKEEELKLPLEASVYKKYLPDRLGRSVTDAAISQQKKAFYEKLGIDPKLKTWNLD